MTDFLTNDFTSGLFLGLFTWLLATGCKAAWSFFHHVATPKDVELIS